MFLALVTRTGAVTDITTRTSVLGRFFRTKCARGFRLRRWKNVHKTYSAFFVRHDGFLNLDRERLGRPTGTRSQSFTASQKMTLGYILMRCTHVTLTRASCYTSVYNLTWRMLVPGQEVGDLYLQFTYIRISCNHVHHRFYKRVVNFLLMFCSLI